MTKRRQFLKASIASTLGATLAGCMGGDGGDGTTTTSGGGDGGDGGGETTSTPMQLDSDVKSIAGNLPDYYPDDYGETIQKAKNEGKLTLYTAHFGSLYESYVKQFTKKFPFINVEVVSLPTAKVYERFSTEASQDKYVPDAVHTYDAVAEGRMDQLGILQSYDSPEKQHIRDGYISDSGRVVSPNFNPYAHAWNPSQIESPPMSLPALAEAINNNMSEWKGNYAMYDGMLSTSMWQTMLQWDRVYGRDTMTKHLKTLAKANPKTFWSTSTMGKWVATGEVQYGIGLAEFILENYVRPDYGTDQLLWGPDTDAVNTIHMGGYNIVKEPSNPNAAKVWFDWYASREAQIWLTENWNYVSARTDISADDVENTYLRPGQENVPMSYEAISEITPFIFSYNELAQKGAAKSELKNLWYQTFVAGG